MPINLKSIYCQLLVLIAATIFSGCSIPIVHKSSDIPSLKTGSPLSRIQQKTFLFIEFRDVRGNDYFEVVNLGTHIHKLDKPVADVISAAIQNEFIRNGHKCVPNEKKLNADFIIEGTIYKYGIGVSRGLTDRILAESAVKLTITNTINNQVFVNSYEGFCNDKPGTVTWFQYISKAQSAMIKDVSTDLSLVEFLEK